jgi:hypothetical protein
MSVIYFPQLGFLQSFPLTAQGLEGLGLEFQFTTEVTAYYKSSRMRGSFFYVLCFYYSKGFINISIELDETIGDIHSIIIGKFYIFFFTKKFFLTFWETLKLASCIAYVRQF